MAMMPILLESTISQDFKPFQELSLKQPSEIEMEEISPFKQLIEAPSESPGFSETIAQAAATPQQDISSQDPELKDYLDEELYAREEDSLEAFFAFCSAPLHPMKDAMETAEAEETHGQKLSKKNLLEDFSTLETAIPETDVKMQKLDLTPEEALLLKSIEALKTEELQHAKTQTLQVQKMEMLSQEQLSEFQEAHAVLEPKSSETGEAFLIGASEQETAEIEPAVAPLLMEEGAHKISYYTEATTSSNSRVMVSQIVDRIPYEALQTEGQQHFKLQIHPKELGEVQVHLVMMEQGKLHATFSGLPYAIDLLQQSSDLLCESLKKEGFDALSENFSFTSDQSFQRGFEREAFVTPSLHPLGQIAQQDQVQLDRLESSMRQLLQHQGSGLSVSLNV
ncbi:MAG: flagellar hook-length control protein FliK [Alphaproteobacteria bacterium]